MFPTFIELPKNRFQIILGCGDRTNIEVLHQEVEDVGSDERR